MQGTLLGSAYRYGVFVNNNAILSNKNKMVMQKLVATLFKFRKDDHTFNFFESNNSNAQPFFPFTVFKLISKDNMSPFL